MRPDPELDAEPVTPAHVWHRTLGACWVAQFATTIGFSFISPFLPFFIRELGGVAPSSVAIWAGLCMTATGLMSALTAPMWGALADRYGRKPMVVRAMIGGGLVVLLVSRVQTVLQLVVLRGVQGAVAGSVVATNTLVAGVSPRERLGFSLGLMQASMLLGAALGPALGGGVADHVGYRATFVVAGTLITVAGLIVLVFARERFTPPDPERTTRIGLRRAFGGRGAATLLIAFFLVMLAGSFAMPIFPLLVEQIHPGERVASTAGLLLGISGVGAGLSALLIGAAGDRIGHRRTLIGCLAAGAIFSGPHALAHSVLQLVFLRVGMGLSRGGTAPVLNAMVGGGVSPDNYGRAFGITRMASALGLALGPLLGGLAAAHMGVRSPFLIMSGLLALNALLVARYVKPAADAAAASEAPVSPPAE